MSVAQLAYPVSGPEASLENAQGFDVSKGTMSASLRRAIAGMTKHCDKTHSSARFIAKGLVVDTLGDVEQQIIDFFPRRINVSPVLEEIASAVAKSARKSKQQFQELSFAYIGDGKPPKLQEANKQFFVKWFSVGSGNVVGSDFGGLTQTLKPGHSAGAGGSGADILSQINFANEKGFVLVIGAPDVNDMRAIEQAMQMNAGVAGGAGAQMPADAGAKAPELPANVIEAFGASPDALGAVQAIMLAGGATVAVIEQLANTITNTKAMQTAMLDAADMGGATHYAAALQVQADGLASMAPVAAAQDLPTPIIREVAMHVEGVRADLSAQSTLRTLDAVLRTPDAQPAAVTEAAHVVVDTAQALGMSVSDVVQLSARQELPAATQHQIDSFTAKAASVPALEVHNAPARVEPARIVEQLSALSQSAPVLEQISQRLAASVPNAENSVAQNITQPMQVQDVVDNLKAISQSPYLPADTKETLIVVVPQVEALAVQVRTDMQEQAVQMTTAQNDNQTPVAQTVQAEAKAPEIVVPVAAAVQEVPAAPVQAPVSVEPVQFTPAAPQVQESVPTHAAPVAHVQEAPAQPSIQTPVNVEPTQPVTAYTQPTKEPSFATPVQPVQESTPTHVAPAQAEPVTQASPTVVVNEPAAAPAIRESVKESVVVKAEVAPDVRTPNVVEAPKTKSFAETMDSRQPTSIGGPPIERKDKLSDKFNDICEGCATKNCGACPIMSMAARLTP